MADRRMLRIQQKRDRARQLPGPHLDRLAPPHNIRRARPHLSRGHRTPGQKKGRRAQPTETDTPTPTRRRLIPLTLAEIRRLLNLDRHEKNAFTHGLQWSIFRRSHQAEARRAHIRRHLRLQVIVI
jgi:hypothetical protein